MYKVIFQTKSGIKLLNNFLKSYFYVMHIYNNDTQAHAHLQGLSLEEFEKRITILPLEKGTG